MPRPRGRKFELEELESYKNPLIRKRSLNVQAFVDVRLVAGVFQYFAGRGLGEPKYSTLLNLVIETFHDTLVRIGKIQPIESPSEALEILRTSGFSLEQLQDKKRNRGIQLSLIGEDMEEGFVRTDDPLPSFGGLLEKTDYCPKPSSPKAMAKWLMEETGLTPDELLAKHCEIQEQARRENAEPLSAEFKAAEKAKLQALVDASAWLETAKPMREFCRMTDCFLQLYQAEDGSVRCRSGHPASEQPNGLFGISFEAMEQRLKGEKEVEVDETDEQEG